MGFDIYISLNLHMCPEQGKPFYYKYNQKEKTTEKVYEMPTLDVPKPLRKYLQGRGHLFHAYTDVFNERDVFEACVEQFLEYYPSWEEVSKHEEVPDYWDEEDHTNFKKLLEWCSVQDCSFHVSWSY